MKNDGINTSLIFLFV